MSLRTRLWLVLAALFLIPLVVGALVIVAVVPQARSERVDDDVRRAAAAVSAQIADQCRLLGLAARTTALEALVTSSPAKAVDMVVEAGYVDYAALLAPDGSVVAQAGDKPNGAGAPADLPRCSQDSAPAVAVLSEGVDVVDGEVGPATAVVTRTVDRRFALDARTRAGSFGDVVLVADGSVVAATTDGAAAAGVADAVEGRVGAVQTNGWTLWAVPPGPGVPYTVVVAVADASDGPNAALIAAIMLAGAGAAGLLVLLVARGLSQPFTEVTEIAERVAQGDLDAAVAADDEGEAGRLGSAVNQMTGVLRRNLSDLESSRADLRSSLERIGDALSSTHDLDRLLTVVLDTARATLAATAGVVVYRSADQLRLVAGQGFDHEEYADPAEPVVIDPGAGVLGRVVTTGSAVRGRIGSGADLQPAGAEPSRGDVLAVPLRSMGSVVGVVALYDRVDGRPFDAADEDALGTLVGQASIAVDNVQLHHEAQRLSTTDPLTGLWNFRYLSMSLAREIERSTRFERPLAVLMLDLDHFKAVNDTYGHHRGDTVLRELALRVQEQIREVDTFARYGGEEFVVVLPETTVEGAGQLAERICAGVRREPFRYENEEPLHVTISVGGAAFPEHGSSPATLMRAADKALYMAKGKGRDQWHIAAT
ncbi:MAG: sensor domain-containing diguanylate cyclase [Spirochaetaceae bacterium]|nr:sensor domain-containing diguanylate cyclase [Spirochaetaceae bacterium]